MAGFGRALTLGVEEELLLVDEQTLALASGVSEILPVRTERLKTELFECIVETTTPVCASAFHCTVDMVKLNRSFLRLPGVSAGVFNASK